MWQVFAWAVAGGAVGFLLGFLWCSWLTLVRQDDLMAALAALLERPHSREVQTWAEEVLRGS